MKMNKICAILVALTFTFVIGCHHNPAVTKTTPTETQAPAPSPSATLTITPDTVDRGQSAQLAWNTQNATTITIDGIGTVSASGSKTVTPASSTTYRLSASGQGGSTEASTRITVNIPDKKVSTTLTDKQLFAQNVKDVFFNYDNYAIREDELQIVNTDAAFLAQHPGMKLLIEGHCDERGSEAYNMGLGENRASSVKETLMQHGVSEDRIRIISYGKEKPFCTSADDETCWQQNRRAHFVLSD